MSDEHEKAVHAICRKIWNRELSADDGFEELKEVIADILSDERQHMMWEMDERD